MIHLNIGCGNTRGDNTINVDRFSNNVDVKADVTDLPFRSNTVDIIDCHHLIEHLTWSGAYKALQEFWRVLKPNGCLKLSCPDLARISEKILNWSNSIDDKPGEEWWKLMAGVYGGDQPGMRHQIGFCKSLLRRLLISLNFKIDFIEGTEKVRMTPSIIAQVYKNA